MKIKSHIIACLALLFCGVISAQAILVELHHYGLGESGTYSGSPDYLALDSVGSSNFTWGDPLSVSATSPSPASTHFSTWNGAEYHGGADLSGLASSEIEISLWVRTSDTSQYASFFSTDNSDDSATFLMANGNWMFYGGGGVWIDGGAAVANQWTKLTASVNASGQTLFYVDDVYQNWGDTALVHGGATLGWGTKGDVFVGDLDEVSVLGVIPEPSVAALFGVFGGGLLFVRHRLMI